MNTMHSYYNLIGKYHLPALGCIHVTVK